MRLEGGAFRIGSNAFYPEDKPVQVIEVASFEIDRYAVTNRAFAAFVDATGYVTTAERPLNPDDFPGAVLDDLRPGSLVFFPTEGPVDLSDWRQWWRWVLDADWRHPRGPGSSIDGLSRERWEAIGKVCLACHEFWPDLSTGFPGFADRHGPGA